MITKEVFLKLMTELESLIDAADAVEESFKAISPDWERPQLFGRWQELAVDAIAAACDGDRGGWISYWLYECNRKPMRKGSITDKDGNDVPLRNMGDLYNLTAEYV